MAKQIIWGVVWCVVFYFGLCFVVGFVAGFIAETNLSPGEDPVIVGTMAGAHAVQVGRLIIAAGAVFFAAAGTVLELLPGTRAKQWPEY